MCKTIPQSDIYKYLYNQYDGVRGFTAVEEHGANLKTLLDKYNGARLDYNDTAFKTTNGVHGISQLVKAFIGSNDVVLPEYFQDTRKFVDGDIIKITDSNTGKVVQQVIYDMDTDTKWVMIGGN